MENGELTLYQTSCKLQFFSHVSYLHTRRIGFLEPAKDMCSKSISSGAQYVTLNKYFPRPILVIYFLATPRIKLKLGQQTGGGLLIANHLDQSL